MALAVSAGYLVLSGGTIPTERAFVMVAVALVAVMLDRRAFSLRTLALAALIVLLLRPEALLSPGFQMSFAATTALIAVFEGLSARIVRTARPWMHAIQTTALSSLVAGAATAPFAAAHFNHIAYLGLAANLLAVPLMGALVMPAAVLSVVLMPLGLEAIGLWGVEWGLRWILFVAQWISQIENSTGAVLKPHAAVLPLLSLGFLSIILWRGRLRWAGLSLVVMALGLWAQTGRPLVLIADTGALVGVMSAEGRALSRARGQGFVARGWLENDGDRADQAIAAARWRGDGRIKQRDLPGGRQLVHVLGKSGQGEFHGCHSGDIVVFSHPYQGKDRLPCQSFDPLDLGRSGAVAIWQSSQGFKSITARDLSGVRPWNAQALRP